MERTLNATLKKWPNCRSAERISMEEPYVKHVGNVWYDNVAQEIDPSWQGSLDDWRERGIDYRLVDPIATTAYTVEQLRQFGLRGVELIYPAD